jgi:type I restriction enzyme R subunit
VFYERLTLYAKTLAIALSSEEFYRQNTKTQIDAYQHDLKFFEHLRSCVRLRYAERIDYRQYEPRIRKLIDQYVGAGAIEEIIQPVDIFDEDAFAAQVARITGEDAKADTIAHRALRTCIDHLQEDPAFYKKFSQLLREAIDAFHTERLKAAEYLKQVSEIARKIIHRTDEDIPPVLRHRDIAKAYFGCVNSVTPLQSGTGDPAKVGAEAALLIDDIVMRLRIVNWTSNVDVQNRMRIEIEDALFDLFAGYERVYTFEEMDEIIEECLKVAKVRVP